MDCSFQSIVLSGGLSKGYISLGVLKYFSDKILGASELIGTSIGSVLCLLLCCGYSPQEIISETIVNDIPIILSGGNDCVGLFSLNKFISNISRLVSLKIGVENPTYQELYDRTGKILKVVVVNATKRKVVVYSKFNTHRKVLDCIHDSCSIPGVFERRSFEGDFMVDGGLLNNFPFDNVTDCTNSKVLGVMVGGGSGETAVSDTVVGKVSYLWSLLTIPIHHINNIRFQNAKKLCSRDSKIIRLSWKFHNHIESVIPTKEEKLKMVVYGVDYAKMIDKSKTFSIKEVIVHNNTKQGFSWDEDDYILDY